ncbi:MAG: cell wall-binding repeat-containing protein, partial [Actinomycetota bacterium]|nr:cell wall-binding repeat-containing protein [Actinomycetota bacterium]
MHGAARRDHLAAIAALALLVALVPFTGVAHAQAPRTQYPGQVGTIVERSGDGLAPTVRYRGLHRFDTARLIATDDQPDFFLDADTVLIARADIFPDALAGNYLAGQLGAPLLLVSTNQIWSDTQEALDDIGPDNIILLGGTEAISQDVQDQFSAEFNVRRIGGVDRYETAALLAAEGDIGELNGQRTAFVANGDVGIDALVSGSISFAEDLPILLTPAEYLDDDTDAALDSLDIEQVVIPGGMVAVEQPTRDAIAAKGIDIVEVEGPSRVETALELARFAVDEFGFTFDHVNFARGDVFVDALTIGPHAGSERSVLLLTATVTTVPQSVLDFIEESRTGCVFDLLHLAGGYLAIAEVAEQQIRQAATSSGVPCNIELTPETATNTVGETHTVTATVTDNVGDPVESVTVTFEVTPETGTPTPVPESGTALTSESGTATFDVNSQTPGTVTIEACITDAEGAQVCDTATKTWVPAEVPPPVGPGGVPELTLSPDLATNVVGQPHQVELFAVEDQGQAAQPAANAYVNLDAYRLDPAAQPPEGSPPGTQVYTLYEDSDTVTDEGGGATVTFPQVAPTDPTVLYLVACAELGTEASGAPFEGDCLAPGSGGQLLVVDGVPQNLRAESAGPDDPVGFQVDFGRKEYTTPPTGLRGIEMSGEEECENRTTRILCGVGDPDGAAVLDLFLGSSEGVICWEISALTGVALPSTGFHIHEAPAGQNGPIVVDLGTVTADGDADCVTGLDPALVADIQDNPADYYANLHTS